MTKTTPHYGCNNVVRAASTDDGNELVVSDAGEMGKGCDPMENWTNLVQTIGVGSGGGAGGGDRGLASPRSPHVKIGNPPSGGPKLTERRTLPLGSRYITVGLLGLGIGTLTLTYNANCRDVSYRYRVY